MGYILDKKHWKKLGRILGKKAEKEKKIAELEKRAAELQKELDADKPARRGSGAKRGRKKLAA